MIIYSTTLIGNVDVLSPSPTPPAPYLKIELRTALVRAAGGLEVLQSLQQSYQPAPPTHLEISYRRQVATRLMAKQSW